jgi:hypothetical protein
MADRKYLKNALTHHPHLSFLRPESMSVGRVKGFTKEEINLFFDFLRAECEEVNSDPSKVFHTDEMGITIM